MLCYLWPYIVEMGLPSIMIVCSSECLRGRPHHHVVGHGAEPNQHRPHANPAAIHSQPNIRGAMEMPPASEEISAKLLSRRLGQLLPVAFHQLALQDQRLLADGLLGAPQWQQQCPRNVPPHGGPSTRRAARRLAGTSPPACGPTRIAPQLVPHTCQGCSIQEGPPTCLSEQKDRPCHRCKAVG